MEYSVLTISNNTTISYIIIYLLINPKIMSELINKIYMEQ